MDRPPAAAGCQPDAPAHAPHRYSDPVHALHATHIRVLRSLERQPQCDLASLLSPQWLDSAEILKQDDRDAVLAGEFNGRPAILKIHRLSGAGDAAARLLGGTRLQREWKGYLALRNAGLPCAEPIALLRARSAHGSAIEALATYRLPGETLLRHAARAATTPRDEHELSTELGVLTARIALAGLHNRDHKPSNIIIDAGAPAGKRLTLIDAAGVRRRRPRGDERMLANLTIEFLGARALPRRALLMRCLRACETEPGADHDHKERWRRISEAIRNHGDPTPKIDPLTH
ncbi:MAG: hypothetical protein EA376_00995 [Phycisphaeraceae bacterium]|nr:MAG: hypothetical protein EA376_00995 [Phycisphaeraceae bacterium]